MNDPIAPGKQHLAVSAIGGDRTGMVHDLTRVITDCGGNIAESRMSALGSEFAMLLLVTGNWHTLARIESELGRLADAGTLSIHLRRTEARATSACATRLSEPVPGRPISRRAIWDSDSTVWMNNSRADVVIGVRESHF